MAEPSPNQDSDLTVFRATLRREKIAARESLADPEHALASRAIEANLLAVLEPRPTGTIAFCWPVRKEFDARPVVTRLIAGGWRACQPVVVKKGAPMAFCAWTPGAPMATDPFGISVPASLTPASPDVVLLPLVAFDEQGYRLGYGGGYFDRTLAALTTRPLSIGVGFELIRVESIQPQAHDFPLDAIVTDARIRRLAPGI